MGETASLVKSLSIYLIVSIILNLVIGIIIQANGSYGYGITFMIEVGWIIISICWLGVIISNASRLEKED